MNRISTQSSHFMFAAALPGFFLTLLLALLPALPAQADDAVGWVSIATGTTNVVSPGQDARPAEVRMGIAQEDVLTTGPDGAMQVVFRDETLLALGADSRLLVLDTLSRAAEGMLHLRLLEGATRLISSQVASANPDKFKLESPLGIIGIRGTEFGVRVLPDHSTVLLYAGGPVLFRSTESATDGGQICAALASALQDAEDTLASAKRKMNVTIKGKMQRRIDELRELQTNNGCTP